FDPTDNAYRPSVGHRSSFDHLIRLVQNRLRYRNADLLCCFQIDHQLELRRLFDGEISRLGTFQNPVDVTSAVSALDTVARSVSHQATVFCIIAPSAYRRQSLIDG